MSNNVQFVITPPNELGADLAYINRARTTIGVFVQLMAQAKENLLIASPFVQSYHGFSDSIVRTALKSALERGVKIDIVSTSLGILTLEKGWKDFATNKINFYQPKPNIINDKLIGSHAKCIISDSKSAYIGSANFTQHGLEEHLEIGVLIEGDVALQLSSFWKYLIEHNYCKLIEDNRTNL